MCNVRSREVLNSQNSGEWDENSASSSHVNRLPLLPMYNWSYLASKPGIKAYAPKSSTQGGSIFEMAHISREERIEEESMITTSAQVWSSSEERIEEECMITTSAHVWSNTLIVSISPLTCSKKGGEENIDIDEQMSAPLAWLTPFSWHTLWVSAKNFPLRNFPKHIPSSLSKLCL